MCFSRAVATTSGGWAVSLGSAEKVFVIYLDQSVGTAIDIHADARNALSCVMLVV